MKQRADLVESVTNYLLSQEDEMKQLLKTFVSFETPSQSKESQEVFFDFLSDLYKQIGYYTLHVPGKLTGGYFYARPKERDRNLPLQLLVGHCDTVWALNTIKDMPILETEEKMKGPGVYDMKAGLIQIYYSLKAVKELGLELKVTPVVLINSDEEIGSHESTRVIRLLAKVSNRALVMEPPLGLDGKIKTERKGIGRFTVQVIGKAAHAGLDPEKGINAIVELSYQVQRLYDMNDPKKGITVNVGMIEGGISANVVAPISKAVVDVRVSNNEDGKYITQKIKELKPYLPDVQLQIEGGIGRPPMEKTDRNRRLWEDAKERASWLGLDLQDAPAGGGSDANTTSQHTATLDGLGTPGDGAHAVHEYILHDQLKERTALLTLMIASEPIITRS